VPHVDSFTRSYLEAALFSSESEDGFPLDDEFSISDLLVKECNKAVYDCTKFRNMLLQRGLDYEDDDGAKFWYARNGHGVSFMDDDDSEDAKKKQEIAHFFGETNLYSYRGKLHFYPLPARCTCSLLIRSSV